jgi:glycosyltransferase involved in cell wall biosynthesis
VDNEGPVPEMKLRPADPPRSTPPPRLSEYRTEPLATSSHGGTRVPVAEARRPTASVITVVLNGAQTFAHVAESILAQDLPDIEYIVIDGGSTDGTVELIRELGERIALWVSEPDGGISDAFNKGIAFARGEVIGIINSDDWYEPGAVRAAYEAMRDTGADVAYGSVQCRETVERTFIVHGDHEVLNRRMTISHPAVFVRRDAYERYGLFRRDFHLLMDYEWLLRAKAAGATFLKINACLANLQPGGVSDRLWHRSQREAARARAMHLGKGPIVEQAFYLAELVRGFTRRVLTRLGFWGVRRFYHRYLSPIRIEETRRSRSAR